MKLSSRFNSLLQLDIKMYNCHPKRFVIKTVCAAQFKSIVWTPFLKGRFIETRRQRCSYRPQNVCEKTAHPEELTVCPGVTRGCLFYGPPGTGKTLVARALANECSQGDKKVAFFMRKGADCLSKWVGESERQLRLLFDQVGSCVTPPATIKNMIMDT